MARLEIRYPNGEASRFDLSEKITTIGRTPANTLQLLDNLASRKHCMIKREPSGFLLRDLESGNGTVVNGARVKETGLSDGDRIQIGKTILTFREDDSAAG